MQDSRNAFQRGSRMGMDFKSSDEPGDWRSTIRSSNTDDRGGTYFILYVFNLFFIINNFTGFTRRRDGGAFDKDHDSERDNGPWRGARRNVDDDVAVGRKPFSDRRFDDSEGGRRPFSDRRSDESEGGRRPFGDRRYDDSDSGRRPFGDRRDDVEGGRKPFGESRRGFGFKREDDLPEIGNYYIINC